MKFPLCFAAVFAFCFGLSNAGAQVVTPNPAPTIITTAPYTITKPGFYQLGKDLTVNSTSGWIIKVDSGNVKLDFGGHYISGPSNSPASQLLGVYVEERGNITVQNGTIAFCNFGVYFHGNGSATTLNINQRVQDMLVTYCYSYGISLENAAECDVQNCRVSYIGGSSKFDAPVGISLVAVGARASNNKVGHVTARDSSKNTGTGIYVTDGFATGNFAFACDQGVLGGICQQNLAKQCTSGIGGFDAGLNNSFP